MVGGSSLVYGLLSCTIVYLGIRAAVLSGETDLVLNDKGICFPANFLLGLNWKRQRAWNDLGRVIVESDNRLKRGAGSLSLIFRSGGIAKLGLGKMKPSEVEQLLLALEVWGKSAEKDEQLSSLLDNLHDERAQIGLSSYTRMWEDELNRHFTSTAFVPLSSGQLLQSGRVRVVEPLAFGGLSAIYLAQLNSTELVVLKESVTEGAGDVEQIAQAQKMFEREGKILTKLSHPQIAKVFDFFVENSRNYLLLEYIAGENIRQIVKQSGTPPLARALSWSLQTAQILDYIHKQEPPVIHRDVTPDNLVLRRGEEVVLIDFGAANEFLGTATGTLVGKQAYISPEQFRGKAVVQSDIYALGCTLFFLLTGQDPEPLSQSHPGSLVPNLPPSVDEFVAACTDFEPNNRPQTASELADRLEELLDNLKEPTST
jgi:tRNA A-37 threonylcarbamoyl transferase component Bud32